LAVHRLNLSEMTQQEIVELAAILVNEHGHAARDVAERRRNQHAPTSYSYRLWTKIAEATARLLRTRQRQHTREHA
jgi:hypothetical protein